MMTERKVRVFCRMLWGMTAAVILLLGYASGVRSRQLTMSGRVHILLETESEGTDRETKQEGKAEMVSPGDTILKTACLRVEKASGKTRVRVKLLADGITAAKQRDLLEDVQADGAWEYSEGDGYFYCLRTLEEGESVTFRARVQIPEKWGQIEDELQFRLELAAEGVPDEMQQLLPELAAEEMQGET